MLQKRESQQVEGDPECEEDGFEYGSRVSLIEKDLQLAKEPAPQMSGDTPSRQREQPVPRP